MKTLNRVVVFLLLLSIFTSFISCDLIKKYPFADFDGVGSEADQNKQENSEESKEENPTPDDLWGNKEGEYRCVP